ncbi:MAG: uroporphyrinogen-III C-methyltransferase [Gammaproteobacteria bacterium]|nr:uroporphyrinogen-III C-methyltransferase [Gammaproteobacteria bacterium]
MPEGKPAATKETAGGRVKSGAIKSNSIKIMVTAFVLLPLGALAVATYMNFQSIVTAHSNNESLQQQNDQLKQQFSVLEQSLSRLTDTTQTLDRTAQDQGTEQTLIKDSLKRLTEEVRDKGRDPILWQFAEIEYLLAIANHRILLERDVGTAIVALQDADKLLDSIGDPALIPIRKQIAAELLALRSVSIPDVSGMAVRLSVLAEGIEKLPLQSRLRPQTAKAVTEETLSGWDGLMQKILGDLKGVVSLRRNDEVIEPLLPPEEQHYLAQNLGLKLEESRMALLRRDTAVFQTHLKDTEQWVGRYFDKESPAVVDVLKTMAEFQSTELKPELPDISGSLRKLKAWVDQHHKRRSGAPAAKTDAKRNARAESKTTEPEVATEGPKE